MRIKIYKDDILDDIYFITAITQKQGNVSMSGALSSKGDLMGGIFDRWINTIPESIVFNKIILPKIDESNQTEIISDYYLYDPKKAGIAPDVIGLKINKEIVPFSVFNEKWIPVNNKPQIEVKSFKEKQYMVTLRDQEYKDKFLVMCETNFRIDYLLPFLDTNIFQKTKDSFNMQDDIFIFSDKNKSLYKLEDVDNSSNEIGTVDLLKITRADAFMNFATFCEAHVSVQYFKGIEHKKTVRGADLNNSLSLYCEKTKTQNVYKFNEEWYEGFNTNNIPYYTKNSRGNKIKFLFRTLDIYIENINNIKVIKKSISSLYIKPTSDANINGIPLNKDSIYRINFDILNRSSNNGEEYFLNKSLIPYIPDYKDMLLNELSEIIKEYK